ncbi:hypothetical protein BCR35DRAFT_311048 [Leucosporidium creatinivorum]|uniref:Uncharacterized protein n=1 Tax=Leucosporidium creatinivorum TaxID=106004 RepID=A0A1Y2CIU1_9BASI|nr:hypothetical protein BCR35DRAFT_311048 [Leucosporidium creatinivorum]
MRRKFLGCGGYGLPDAIRPLCRLLGRIARAGVAHFPDTILGASPSGGVQEKALLCVVSCSALHLFSLRLSERRSDPPSRLGFKFEAASFACMQSSPCRMFSSSMMTYRS